MEPMIGLLGGGQLANLIALSAIKRGYRITAYCQSIDDPIISSCDQAFVGKTDDRDKLLHFFKSVDIVLLESEFFAASLLKELQTETGTTVYPHLDDYVRLYTKSAQKEFMLEVDIPFAKTISVEELNQNFEPMIMKVSHGGYDGYGNKEVRNKLEALQFVGSADPKNFFLEEKLNIKAEFACLLVKGRRNSFIFDPCETIQSDQKCLFVNDHPRLDGTAKEQIRSYVKKIDQNLKGPGIYAFEFFLDENQRILFNEAAPRVHNSYHFSMEAYTYSQFDLFINAVMDEELHIPERKFSHSTMLNIVGVKEGQYLLTFPYREDLADYKIHMYGKKKSRPGRKLGHITFYGNNQTFESAKWVFEEHKL